MAQIDHDSFSYHKNNKAKNFTRGGQITFHNWRMLFQINKTVGKIYVFTGFSLFVMFFFITTPFEVIQNAFWFCYAKSYSFLKWLNCPETFRTVFHGKTFPSVSVYVAEHHPYFHAAAISCLYHAVSSAIFAVFLSSLLTFFIVRWLTKRGEEQTESRYIRGSKLDTSKNVSKMIRKNRQASMICIGNLPLIRDSETQHVLVHGTTGTGKSQLIAQFLDQLRRRGDKVLLYDKGGVYTPIYYRAGKDKLLNPFDERCENWDLWSEAIQAPDFENMAESLIPMHGETDPFWVNAARTIFGSAAFTMQDDRERSISKLLKLLLTAELKELEKYLEHTAAATLASDKNERTAISIRSVLTTYSKALRFLEGLQGTKKSSFSIRDWMHHEYLDTQVSEANRVKDDSWLFISSNAEQHASLRSLISMWFAMASITLLSLPENRDRRIWFICDELPSLHKLPQLPETIAEARKFGGCFMLGMQSHAQLEKVYGRNAGKELFDLLNTRFFFRSPSAEMARFVSTELGEQEFEDVRENYSYGANTIRDGISIGAQPMIRPIVSYPEIMELPDLKCYVRLPAAYPVCPITFSFKKRERIASSFMFRTIPSDPEIEEAVQREEDRLKLTQKTANSEGEIKKTVARKIKTQLSKVSTQPGEIKNPPSADSPKPMTSTSDGQDTSNTRVQQNPEHHRVEKDEKIELGKEDDLMAI